MEKHGNYMQIPIKQEGGGVKQMPVVTFLMLKGIYFLVLSNLTDIYYVIEMKKNRFAPIFNFVHA